MYKREVKSKMNEDSVSNMYGLLVMSSAAMQVKLEQSYK